MPETSTLVQHIEAFSYLGIFVAAMLANIAIVVPEEIVLLAIGYIVGTGMANGYIAVPIVILGLLITDTFLYTLFKHENRVIMYLYNKFFAWRIKSRLPWLEKHINKVIFFSRFMVQFRFLGPSLAGQMKVPRRTFIKFELLALIIYVPILIWAGSYFRNRIELVSGNIRTVHNIAIIAVGILVLIAILQFARKLILRSFKKEK